MARIVVSFKSTKEDQDLYDEICNNSDKSAYVKDKIREYNKFSAECEEYRSKCDSLVEENRTLLKKYNELLEKHSDLAIMFHNNSQVITTNQYQENVSEKDIKEIKIKKPVVETPKPKEIEVKEAVQEVVEVEVNNASKESVITKDVISNTKPTTRRKRAPRLNSHDY